MAYIVDLLAMVVVILFALLADSYVGFSTMLSGTSA